MMRRPRITRLARQAAVPAARRVAEYVARQGIGIQDSELPEESMLTLPSQAMADRMPLILFSYDVLGRKLLHCNQHCQTVLGYTTKYLLELGPHLGFKLLHADSRAKLLRSDFNRLLGKGKSVLWDCRLLHRDGSWRWLRIQVRASAFGPNGQVREMVGSAEDVTRYRATVDQLRQNRYLFRQVMDLVPNVIYIYDLLQQRSTYINKRIEAVLGLTDNELLELPAGQALALLMPADSVELFTAHLAAVAQLPDGRPLTIEYPIYHRNGTLRWMRSTHTPFARDANGQVTSVIGVAEDITERRSYDEQTQQATTHLAEQHRLFRQVIDALPHPIYLKDGAGNYQLANHATAALFGLTPEELERDGLTHDPGRTSDEAAARQQGQDQRVLHTGQDTMREESHTYPDGTVAWFSSVKKLFVQADGTAQVLGVDSNITELKHTQQALEAAVASAEVDARAKQDFLANMSHEIRTPLHGILGLTGVLSKTVLSRSQHDYLRLLGESAEHLLTVLNDVLTTARLGAGKLRPETIAFEPAELLANCAALLRPQAREKGLRLHVEKPIALPAVLGDAHRLRQVLLNLVSNAIKFTETGKVHLGVRLVPSPHRHAEPAGTLWLQFKVSDTGVGMAADTLDKVFEPFAQAAASTDREYGGSGLGLSISEGLVQLMGGVLCVCSEVGQGSTFAFTLAFQPVPLQRFPNHCT
jgi:PAS domain S-box-containing protein